MARLFRRLFSAAHVDDVWSGRVQDLMSQILDLKAQVEAERQEKMKIFEKLCLAVRLTERSEIGELHRNESMNRTRSWPEVQSKLEKKYSSPESDAKHKYWTNKIKEQEDASSQPEAVRVHADGAEG